MEEHVPDVKRMRLRRDGVCSCGARVQAGGAAGWDRVNRAVVCPACLTRVSPHSTGVAVAPSQRIRRLLPPPETSAPGASLDREYERRRARREQAIRHRHPVVGGVVLALTSEPSSTTAFATGAVGERRLAALLEERSGSAVLLLHNRRLGGGRRDGDIDHLAITSSGIYAIDAKHYRDAEVEVRRSGGVFAPRVERLYVRGRDATRLLEGVQRQTRAVREALVGVGVAREVPVRGVLCFVDAQLPTIGSLEVDGVPILGPRRTVKLLRTEGPLPLLVGQELYAVLAQRLPPAA